MLRFINKDIAEASRQIFSCTEMTSDGETALGARTRSQAFRVAARRVPRVFKRS